MCCYTDDMAQDDIATLTDKVDALTTIVTNGFEAIASDMADFRDDVSTRFDTIEDRLSSIEHEVSDIRSHLEKLDREMMNVTGFRKEIDHAFERLAAIEHHLGIAKKIAA